MKKIFTLLWLTLAAFTFKATAQTNTTCNAEFTVQYVTNFSVKFNPAIVNDSPFVQHTWSFGDGSPVNHVISPTHTYTLPSSYSVVHTIIRTNPNNVPVCTQTFTRVVTITEPCNLVVDYSWTVAAANPLTLEFHNLTVPLSPTDSTIWNFGDGTTSYAANPAHTYANYGTYNVCLIVKKYSAGTTTPCIKYSCKTITVTHPCNIIPNFNWTIAQTNPLTFEFHNLSTNLATSDSIRWTFGDGTSSTSLNPIHTYSAAGTYTVCLRIARHTLPGEAPCVREICKTVVVTQPCNLAVDYSWTVAAANPLTLEFHNLTVPLSPTDSTIWNFGDGTTSYAANPAHTYANYGTYNVCLIVKKYPSTSSTLCVRYSCKTITVTQPCNIVPNFNWTIAQTNPLTFEFHNLSTNLATSDSIRWTFGDGTSSTSLNPVHTYNAAGTYTVCLRIARATPAGAAPCVREICKTVVVTQPCNFVVDYSWTVATANPLTLEFHNLTVPLSPTDSTIWNFGDGTTSYAANPAHTYANYGTYNVCLIVKKYPSASSTPCVRYSCKTITVTQPCNIVADFNWTIAQTNLLTFEFHNLSTNLATSDSIRWTFGDGTSSTSLNPVHTYSAAGTYTVCLRIARHTLPGAAPCVREICKTVVVTQPCTLVANFTSQPNPSNPLQVRFTNTSTPLNASDSIRWTFGDGTSVIGVQSDAMVANPVHNYTTAGTFTVCLRVKKNNNTTATGCVREICHTIAVTQPCNFAVNFSWRLDSANVRKVYFTNLTVAPTANAIAVWSFGDGTSATSWNAVHEYAQPGAYRVCLRVYLGTNTNCVRETCDTVIVHAPPPACTQLSLYHFERVANDIQKYKFTPDYINTSYQYTWTFGDGTGSHDPIATHRYAHPGVYTACLTVWRGPDCASTTCNEINVQLQINCDTSHVGYSYQADPAVPNNIHFYANATLPILDQTWTITRLNGTTSTPSVILHQNNPAYLFPDTGYYRVCLRAIIVGGCVKEFCNTIRITQVANGCQLQAFPNPATNSVAVNVYLTQPESIHASVYNSLNVLVLDKTQQGLAGNNVVNFNIAALAAGLYTIRFVYGTHVCYARFQKL